FLGSVAYRKPLAGSGSLARPAASSLLYGLLPDRLLRPVLFDGDGLRCYRIARRLLPSNHRGLPTDMDAQGCAIIIVSDTVLVCVHIPVDQEQQPVSVEYLSPWS